METRKKFEIPIEMEQLRQQLDSWRSAHAPRTRIPDELWSAAVRFVEQYGLHRTARTLGLDYARLKAKSGMDTGKKAASGVSFVEIVPVSGGPECVVEFEDARGKKMRVQIRGTGAPDWVTLSRIFWSGRA